MHLLSQGPNNNNNNLIVGGLGINGAPTVQAPMEPHEAARSIYPTMAKALQKYLKFTKQSNGSTKHNLNSIYDHLTNCLRYDLSPRTFLERFFQFDPAYQQSEIDIFRNCNGMVASGHNTNNQTIAASLIGGVAGQIGGAASGLANSLTNHNNHSTMGMQNILTTATAQQQQQHDKHNNNNNINSSNNNSKDLEGALSNSNHTTNLINSWGLISDVLLCRTIQSGEQLILSTS